MSAAQDQRDPLVTVSHEMLSPSDAPTMRILCTLFLFLFAACARPTGGVSDDVPVDSAPPAATSNPQSPTASPPSALPASTDPTTVTMAVAASESVVPGRVDLLTLRLGGPALAAVAISFATCPIIVTPAAPTATFDATGSAEVLVRVERQQPGAAVVCIVYAKAGARSVAAAIALTGTVTAPGWTAQARAAPFYAPGSPTTFTLDVIGTKDTLFQAVFVADSGNCIGVPNSNVGATDGSGIARTTIPYDAPASSTGCRGRFLVFEGNELRATASVRLLVHPTPASAKRLSFGESFTAEQPVAFNGAIAASYMPLSEATTLTGIGAVLSAPGTLRLALYELDASSNSVQLNATLLAESGPVAAQLGYNDVLFPSALTLPAGEYVVTVQADDRALIMLGTWPEQLSFATSPPLFDPCVLGIAGDRSPTAPPPSPPLTGMGSSCGTDALSVYLIAQ